jgi:hypothetical protein
MLLATYHYDTIPDSEVMDHHDLIILGYWQVRSTTDMTLVYQHSGDVKSVVDAIHAAGKKVVFQLYAPWDSSGTYNEPLKDSARRYQLIANIKTLITQYGFDGVNFDWESDDRSNITAEQLTTVYRELRASLGSSAIITATENFGRVVLTPEATNYLDWIGLMTYDVAPASTWFGTVADVESCVNMWKNAGFSASKLIPGINLAGREGGSQNSWISYYDIIAVRNPAANLDMIDNIYYNGVNTVKAKLDKIKELGCGGAFLYTAGMDTNYTDSRSIVAAAYKALKSGIEPIPEVVTMTVTFEGTLKDNAGNALVGEQVTIKVTKPDSTVDNLNTTVAATGFKVSMDYPTGNYSAIASYAGNSTYKASTSNAVPFVLTPEKIDTVITLGVTL